ncbi:STAS domain-containing protein [candidate division KSB1 bacterium]|nr:STAS domain-containing protein [candidate division KSB1 bacterium]
MHIKENKVGTVHVISLSGRLDAQNAPLLDNRTSTTISEGTTHIVLDMEKVDYISSSGLRAIVSIVKSCREKKGDCRIANLQPAVYNILELGGFENIIQIFESTETAVSSFRDR